MIAITTQAKEGEQMSHPTLGIMAIYMGNRKFEELSYFRKLSLKGKQLGLKVMVFSPEDVDHDRKKINGLFYSGTRKSWLRKWVSFPDIIYDRCRNQGTSRFAQLKQFRTRYPDLVYMNRPLANKWGMYQILYKNKQIRPHLPYTTKFMNFQQVSRLLRRNKTLYLKPSNGTGGRGIIRIRSASNDRLAIQGRDFRRRIIPAQALTHRQLARKLSTWPLQRRYMIQQGIELNIGDGRVHDYRLLMQKNEKGTWEMTGCAGRIGPRNSITSNLHGGGKAVKMDWILRSKFSDDTRIAHIKQTMINLGKEIAHYLESTFGKLCELGLDIAVDSRGDIWLLEINPKPSREVFRKIGEKQTYHRAIIRPLQYALWIYKSRQSDNKTVAAD